MSVELRRPTPGEKLSVLFCCLGNICRSPMAEGAFRHTVEQLGVADHFNIIDSCGTAAYHTGKQPDQRTVNTLATNGIPIDHKARQICKKDYSGFDYILAMDASNLRDLKSFAPENEDENKAKIMLFGYFGGKDRKEIVEDPYYGGTKGFRDNFDQVVRFSKGFVKELLEEARE